jgi:NADH pyrophosphatase NudC (nudix superfamily)
MARNRKASPEVEKVRPYLDGVAKSLVDRLYGPQGPPWGTRLAELEEVVLAVRQLLSEEMLSQALQRQAETVERPPEYQGCPGCGQAVQPREPEPRLLHTKGGEAEWQEPHTYCRKCRQAFFPSEQEPGDRSE